MGDRKDGWVEGNSVSGYVVGWLSNNVDNRVSGWEVG